MWNTWNYTNMSRNSSFTTKTTERNKRTLTKQAYLDVSIGDLTVGTNPNKLSYF